MNNFGVLSIAYIHFPTSIRITILTDNPCHLTAYYTDKEPLRHKTSRIERGIALPWGAYFCFVAWKSLEQTEPGDTLYHTFEFNEWPTCLTIIEIWDLSPGLSPPYWEPWGSTLTQNHPWEENGFLFGSETILADGQCSIFNNGQGGINISVAHLPEQYPLQLTPNIPLSFAHHATHIDYHPTDGWLSYYFETSNGIDSYLIEPLIARGSRWGVWGTYKSASPTTYAFDLGQGPQTLNLLEAWIEGRTLAGLNPDPTGWYLTTSRIANEQFATAADQTITTDYFNLFYPLAQIKESYGGERYFTFRGTIADALSPSVSPIFQHCHPGIITNIEQQILYNSIISIADFIRAWAGQRLTISNRVVTKLAFVLNKFGSPTGDVTFQIRRVSDDSILVQKVWGSAAALQPEGSEQWEEVEFDTPTFTNEEVRLVVYYPDNVSNFRVRQHFQDTDVKADEYVTYRSNDFWTDVHVYDLAYRYTFFT